MRARLRPVHRLTGPNLVSHFTGCGCDFIRSSVSAPWVTYDMVDGLIRCVRCQTTDFLPTPSVRVRPHDKNCTEVYIDHDAIVGELEGFKEKHSRCPGTAETICDDKTVVVH